AYGFDDVLRAFQLLRHREQAAVGNALERRRDAEAGSPDRVEPGLLDQLGAERVMGADRLDDPRPAHQLAELGGWCHGGHETGIVRETGVKSQRFLAMIPSP